EIKIVLEDVKTVVKYFKDHYVSMAKLRCIQKENYAEIQQKIQNRWNYIYHLIMTIAFILDPNYLKESKNNNNESDCFSTFANFISLKYSTEEASRIYAELLKFRNKQMPYNNELIWNSAVHLNPSAWWSSWPLSELQKLAILLNEEDYINNENAEEDY
ncbi:23447_t:CDS:2, partial [Gigaspora rosea]